MGYLAYSMNIVPFKPLAGNITSLHSVLLLTLAKKFQGDLVVDRTRRRPVPLNSMNICTKLGQEFLVFKSSDLNVLLEYLPVIKCIRAVRRLNM